MNAIIVEDEIRARSALNQLLKQYCPEVNLVGEAGAIPEAVKLIDELQPDLVFLDIHLPQQDGFKLFEYYPKPNFETIFTTAYSKFSLMALRLSAIDYLLKPINKDELISAVNRATSTVEQKSVYQNITALRKMLSSNLKKIPLPTNNGFIYVNIEEIIMCEASRNYTNFYLIEDRKILISKNLKTYEELLINFNFMRISRSYIINLNFVEAYMRTNGGEVVMTNEITIPVSPQNKNELVQRLNS